MEKGTKEIREKKGPLTVKKGHGVTRLKAKKEGGGKKKVPISQRLLKEEGGENAK